MYPAGFYSSSVWEQGHTKVEFTINYVSTLAKNGRAMAGPVGPVPVPMLYGNQVQSYLVMWMAILFKNGDEEDNDSRAVFINSATVFINSSCSEHLASSWKFWCENGGKKWKSWQSPGVEPWTQWLMQPVLWLMLEINEYRWYEPEVSRVQLLATAGIFAFLYFQLITSMFSVKQDTLSI